MNPTWGLDAVLTRLDPLNLLAVALLATVPLGALLLVRHRQPEHPPRLSLPRFLAFYLLVGLILLLASVIDELPMALGLLGVILGLFGLGIGVEPLYRYLYGDGWLEAHPGVARRDTVRWERATLLLALVCLVSAVWLALQWADVAGGVT